MKFHQIEGLDTKDGLTRIGGNRTLYLKLLRQFLTQQAPADVQIAEALAANDSLSAERLAHTVKGVAGSLGARELQQVAGTLEKTIASKSPTNILEDAQRKFNQVLDDFMARLGTALPEETPKQASVIAEVDPDQLRRIVQEMIENLNNFDPAAGELFDAHRDLFRAFFPAESFEAFERQISNFSFADAMNVLQNAAKQK